LQTDFGVTGHQDLVVFFSHAEPLAGLVRIDFVGIPVVGIELKDI
jgi:hypothetical protein